MKVLRAFIFLLVAAGVAFLFSSHFFRPSGSADVKTSRKATSKTAPASTAPTTVAERNHGDRPFSEPPVTRTVPVAPSPLDRPSDEELRRFPTAKVTLSAEVSGPGPAQSTRVRILATDFKYPNIRTEEIVDQATGKILTREEMVADHVLVTLRDGEDPSALLDTLNLAEASLETVSPDPAVPLYRLQLPSASLEAIPTVLAALDKAPGSVVSAEPDFIRQGLLAPTTPSTLMALSGD